MQKTFQILSRGRKYYRVQAGKYTGELVINEASADLLAGQTVTLDVQDVSERSRYGLTLRYLPITAQEKARLAAAEARQEAEKWLGYAEGDARQGMSRTNAIQQAATLAAGYPELSARLAALLARIAANQEREQEQRQAQAAERAQQQAAQAERRSRRVLYPLSDLPRLNVPMRLWKQAVVFESTGRTFKIDEDHPSVEGSHLLGHEGESGCYCYYRPATEAESAALAEQEQQAAAAHQAAQERKAKLQHVAEQIRTTGEQPEGDNVVTGEYLHNTMDIYGGGEAFVITAAHIWYLRNNGMDGDDWSRNNVRTGGAGAIGWRIPYDPEIASALR